MKQLKKVFFGKCYICEIKPVQDPQVEHLYPHKGNIDKKFDWNNLFYSCSHCNNVLEDGTAVKAMTKDPIALKTAELMNEVFNLKNTGIRCCASDVRFKALKGEMMVFFKCLNHYHKHPDKLSQRYLISLLRKDTLFSSFKRSYLRTHKDIYGDLISKMSD